jgi:hypothetical protein
MNRLRNHFILGQTIYSSTLPQIPRTQFQEPRTQKPKSQCQADVAVGIWFLALEFLMDDAS